MPRIRTIKPEFFTSEDIVTLTPYARLLYVALWCEADREGRLKWKPKTFKTRYLPEDQVDIEALGAELIERRHVVLYGDGLAWMPKFKDHQYINPREAASILPVPPVDNSRVDDASSRVTDVHVGREGKEGKGKDDASSRVEASVKKNGTAIVPGWWQGGRDSILAVGVELGIPPRSGEEMQEYKNRLFDEINRRKAAA